MVLVSSPIAGRDRTNHTLHGDTNLPTIPQSEPVFDIVQRTPDVARIEHLAKWNTDIARNLSGWTPEVEAYFRRHLWLGKVRELENTIKRGVVLAREDRITLDDLLLPAELATSPEQEPHVAANLQEFLDHAAVPYSKRAMGCAEKPRVVLALTARRCIGSCAGTGSLKATKRDPRHGHLEVNNGL